MTKALITIVPFVVKNRFPLELFKSAEIDSDFYIIIAGTEPISEFVMSNAKELNAIDVCMMSEFSGLDGVTSFMRSIICIKFKVLEKF